MAVQTDARKARFETYRKFLNKEKIYCPASVPEKAEDNPFAGAGSYVLGPMVNTFVTWVLQEALKSGKKRLYFLARDGYFMYRTAKIYVEKLNLPIDCRYVSCSRYSLRIPMYHLDVEDAMDYICRDSIDATLTRVLNRAGLDMQEQKDVLNEIGETGHENEPVPYVRLAEIKEKLYHSKMFMEYMLRHSEDAMPALQGYLRQEGFLDGAEDAIVDSGWVGSMQKTLNQMLKSMGRKSELEGYYWGLYELPPGVPRETYHCYYFSPEGQLSEKVNFNNNLFETIFSAPHGMTLRYEEKDGKYIPVYDSIAPERKQYMEQLETVLLGYTEKAAESVTDISAVNCRKDKKAMKKLLKLFMGNPTKDEAEVYGTLVFCDDVLEYGSRQLAAVMDEKDLTDNHVINKILVMLGIRKTEIKESAWYEGSVVRYAKKRPRYHLMQYGMYKYLLYIRQMYMWRRNNVQR